MPDPRAVVLDDGTIELEPSSQRLTALRTAGRPYRFFAITHPDIGSRLEIGKKVYEVQAGPDAFTIQLRLVGMNP